MSNPDIFELMSEQLKFLIQMYHKVIDTSILFLLNVFTALKGTYLSIARLSVSLNSAKHFPNFIVGTLNLSKNIMSV